MTTELVKYNAAKQAISECVSIDECKGWKDKAAALAAYAKMRDDDELENYARRIRGRATRRIGEILMEIKAQPGRRTDMEPGGSASPRSQTRKGAAASVGLSSDQMKEALRIARVSKDEFEYMVEARKAPTLDELAERGRSRVPKTLSDDEQQEQYGKDALKSFQSWNGLVPELDKLGKSIAAIEAALSDDA
jgi:hypothetical protein